MSEEAQALQTESPTVPADSSAPEAAPNMTEAFYDLVQGNPAAKEPTGEATPQTGSEAEGALDPAAATDPTKKHEPFIPYERFEEVNTKAKTLEAKMAEIEVERQAAAAWNPALEAIRQLGYKDPGEFVAQVEAQKQAEETAKVEGEINAYRDFVIGQYGQEVGEQLAEAKRLNVMNELRMKQVEEREQTALRQIATAQLQAEQAKAIDAAIAKAPPATHPILKSLLQDVHPSYMAKATEQLNALIQAAKNDGVAQYASGKQDDAAATSPVSLGSGGQARPITGDFKESVQAIKSSGGFWDLVAKHGRT